MSGLPQQDTGVARPLHALSVCQALREVLQLQLCYQLRIAWRPEENFIPTMAVLWPFFWVHSMLRKASHLMLSSQGAHWQVFSSHACNTQDLGLSTLYS